MSSCFTGTSYKITSTKRLELNILKLNWEPWLFKIINETVN